MEEEDYDISPSNQHELHQQDINYFSDLALTSQSYQNPDPIHLSRHWFYDFSNNLIGY